MCAALIPAKPLVRPHPIEGEAGSYQKDGSGDIRDKAPHRVCKPSRDRDGLQGVFPRPPLQVMQQILAGVPRIGFYFLLDNLRGDAVMQFIDGMDQISARMLGLPF